MSTGIHSGRTEPTDRRGGPEIVPTRVMCPFCEREGVTDRAVNLCLCGRWFEVTDATEVEDA